MLKFRFITPADPEYPQELMLRWEVLAKPLGIPPGKEQPAEESESLHLIALEKKKMVGCVLFCPEGALRGRVHQMALSEEYQGRGFGRKMLSKLEQTLAARGFKEIYLLAPTEKVGFYNRMGFESDGEPKKDKDVFWQCMTKKLD
jgi:N-acetylglutamate synthase-like GNAT family acetyltransferase